MSRSTLSWWATFICLDIFPVKSLYFYIGYALSLLNFKMYGSVECRLLPRPIALAIVIKIETKFMKSPNNSDLLQN